MEQPVPKISTVSERLKEAMKIKGKKQVDLCRATGIYKGSLTHYVSGRYEPKSDTLEKLAVVLGVSEKWLRGYDVPMEQPPEQEQEIEIEDDLAAHSDVFEFAEILARLRSDAEFRDLVEKLCKLDSAKLNGVINMLNAFT